MPAPSANPIILYDGVCGLCNRFVQFVLKRDTHDRLRFASLQSAFARNILVRHGVDPVPLETMYVVLNYNNTDELLIDRSEAPRAALLALGGKWLTLAILLSVPPRWARNWVYGQVTRNRYRVFGKYEQCLLPEERYRHKFLDM